MKQWSPMEAYQRVPAALRPALLSCLGLILLFGLGLILPPATIFDSPDEYLPIHTLVEMLSVLVSSMLFFAAWRLRDEADTGYLPMLGGAFLAVAVIDILHTLSYPGMPDFITPNNPEKAIDFWLAGRFIAITSLLLIALFATRAPKGSSLSQAWLSTLAGITTTAFLFYIVIYHEASLPNTFIPGEGLTPFKITAEYLLIAIALLAFAIFANLTIRLRNTTHAWLGTAALAFALAEFFFTRYENTTDLMNLLGHIYKTLGSLSIYAAFFVRREHRPWWGLESRLRLFAFTLVGIFATEYLIMITLQFFMPEKSGTLFEAVMDASAMALISASAITIGIGYFQSRAMRAEYALDNTHDGYCVINTHGEFVDINQSFSRMFGYPVKELFNLDIFTLEAPDLEDENRLDIPRIIAHGHLTHLTQFWDRQGNIIDLEVSATHLPAVQSIVLYLKDITTLKRFEQQIDNLAFYDQLTQLPNRQMLMEHLGAAQARSAQSGMFGAVLTISLDGIKELNYAKGSDIGDEFLIVTAKQISGCLQGSGIAARTGDEEFTVIAESLGDTVERSWKEGIRIAERLRSAITTPVRLGRHGEVAYQGSASIGIALFNDHRESTEVIIRQSTIAMHQAKADKAADTHEIRLYSAEMQRLVSERIELADDLRTALDEDQLELYYQPQVDREGRILGAEALLRWQHPSRGMVSPAMFIPIAEETRLILPIGRQLLQKACRQLKAWQSETGLEAFTLSVNISAAQFRSHGFVAEVKEELVNSGIAPETLKLELTESMLVENVQQTIRRMRELTGLGIRFSMDDFGTGYSSLSYLTSLPLSQLKIDQSFVRHLDTNPNNAAVVRTIIKMGQALKLDIIAEGVETDAELNALEESGCHVHQGYLFSKPLQTDAMSALLKKGTIFRPATSANAAFQETAGASKRDYREKAADSGE